MRLRADKGEQELGQTGAHLLFSSALTPRTPPVGFFASALFGGISLSLARARSLSPLFAVLTISKFGSRNGFCPSRC